MSPPRDQQRDQPPLLELIYAIRTLGQSLELMHQDLRSQLQVLATAHGSGVDRLVDLLNEHAREELGIPVATADRVLILLEKKVDASLDDVRQDINEIRKKLWVRAISAGLVDPETGAQIEKPLLPAKKDDDDITGKIELMKDGRVNATFQSAWIGKAIKVIAKAWPVAKWVAIALAGSGGAAALAKTVHDWWLKK